VTTIRAVAEELFGCWMPGRDGTIEVEDNEVDGKRRE